MFVQFTVETLIKLVFDAPGFPNTPVPVVDVQVEQFSAALVQSVCNPVQPPETVVADDSTLSIANVKTAFAFVVPIIVVPSVL